MNAQELRIGNLVNIIGITPVKITAEHILSISKGDDDYEPIPLNEEWLVKMGFTKPNDWHCMLLELSDEEDIRMRSSLQLSFVGCGYVSVCRSGINAYSAKVEYVHQLQNLYFALTNKELTINL
jgi:hypothetical protein